MEKIRLTNGNEYDVILGGLQRKNGGDGIEQLRLLLATREDISFDSVEADFSVAENTSNIGYIGVTESIEDVISGYTILKSVEKCKDYLVGHNTTPLEDGGYNMEEIRDTVYVVLLQKPDFQSQFNDMKETLDMMLLSVLEG